MLAGGDDRSRDWTALPKDLLACIRGRLSPVDFARFAAVCTVWRRAAPSTPAPQLPWLMVPPSPSSSSSSPGEAATCRFFSPSDGRTFLVLVPELRGTRCVGVCEGWVASFDDDTAETSLVNPLTRAQIPLPGPLTTMPRVTAARDEEGRIVQYRFGVDKDRGFPIPYTRDDVHGLAKKVVMSSQPTDAACKLVAAFDELLPPMSIAVGGEKWKVLEGGEEVLDIVCHGADGEYYGLNYDSIVLRWDANCSDAVEYCQSPDFPRNSYRYQRHLLVHRPSGDLLLVFIDFEGLPKSQNAIAGTAYKTRAVEALRYKGDDDSAGAWLRLESLSGCSLFLGRNQPICLSAQDVPHLRADCIFFIGEDLESGDGELYWTHILSVHDRMELRWTYRSWVYDLKEGTLEPYCPDWKNSDQAPLWFTPNLS